MSRKITWILALIMAGLSAMLVYRTMEGNTAKRKAAVIPTTKAMVAVVAIPPRTVIKPEWVELKVVPVSAVPADALKMPQDVVGKITRSDILPGETIRKERLLGKDEKLGLPFMIPQGFRGMTIAVDEVIGVAGFLKPGDLVDVLVTFNVDIFEQKLTATILQGIQVLGVAQDLETVNNNETAKKGKVVSSVTLAVTPEQAEQLALAVESGKIRLSARPLNSREQVAVSPINPHLLLKGVLPAPVARAVTPSEQAKKPVKTAPREQKTPKQTPPPNPSPSPSPSLQPEKKQKKVEVILGEKSVQVNVE
jgi:pilus assembly protein CpaB